MPEVTHPHTVEADPASTRPAPDDRRRGRRYPVARQAQVECRKGSLGVGPNLCAAAVDLSEDGAGLVLRSSLALGQEVEVLLSAAGIPRPLKRLAQVVGQQELEGGGFGTEVRFDRRLTFTDLQRLTRPTWPGRETAPGR